MNHKKAELDIFTTTDYDKFRMISGNRGLNETKIKRIIKEIESGNDVLKYYPIQVKPVGDMLEILDGQHRYFIAQKLTRPIYYIIIEEKKTMADIAKINSNTEKWTQQNYIDCYISQGNAQYKKLQLFLSTYKINVGTSLMLLTKGSPGTEGDNELLREMFQHGKIQVTYWDEAVSLADDCKKFSAFKSWTDRAFVIAIYRIRKAGLVSIEELRQAFTTYPEMLIKNFSYKEYVNNLEQIINKRKQKRIVII